MMSIKVNTPQTARTPSVGIQLPARFPAGTYPHIGDGQEFWIEDPPRWGDKSKNTQSDQPDAKVWTTNFRDFADNTTKYQYLPSVLMHEFGHTLGLQHGVRGETIMRGATREIEPCVHAPLTVPNPNPALPDLRFECGLADDDKEGLEAIYGP